MIEKQLADATLDAIKVITSNYDRYGKQLAQELSKAVSLLVSVAIGFMIIFLFGIAVFLLIVNIIDHQENKKIKAFELQRVEKEAYYWNVAGKCADIQLACLLAPPIQQQAQDEVNAIELTREHFDPRTPKGGLSRDDYD